MSFRKAKRAPVVLATLVGLSALTVAYVVGAGEARNPVDLSGNGVQGEHKLHNKKGQLLLYNFRTVVPGVLYRGSGFPNNVKYQKDGKPDRKPAAYVDGQMFEFFRARNIRLIVNLQKRELFYRERGHFQWWGEKTGYNIEVVNLEVESGAKGYERGSGGGLRAAEKFIDLMKQRDPQRQGAVYVHCDAGKDRTGVVVAAYEMWRNWGSVDNDTLWNQVQTRYLTSDALIGSDQEAMNFSGKRESCSDGSQGFVCAKWLDDIRPDLEAIARDS